MKKCSVKVIIAIIAMLIGLIGVVLCILPMVSPEARLADKYITAVDKQNQRKMDKCTIKASDLAENMTDEYKELLEEAEEYLDGEKEEKLSGKKAFLQSSAISVNFPEGFDKVKEVKKIKMLGCTKKDEETMMGIHAVQLEVLVEIQYVTDEKKPQTKTIYVSDNLALVKTKKGYRVADF